MVPIELLTELASLQRVIRGEQPDSIKLGGVDVRVDYCSDPETDDEYAALEVALPDGWLAEVEEETVGQLTGVRLYLSDSS